MLRNSSSRDRVIGIALTLVVGVLAAVLVLLGNPGNMGICGACFLRDIAGALRLFPGGPAYLRPEIGGVLLGAMIAALVAGKFGARSSGFAVGRRFIFGIWMAVAALVFLGCPFRMLQRLGGGDLNAWIALPGFIGGVGIARFFERRGVTPGKTSPAPLPVGLLAPAAVLGLIALYLAGGFLAGPTIDDVTAKPPHAPWLLAFGIALAGGALLSWTGFCAISAGRQIFAGPRPMLWAALALIAGYGVALMAASRFAPGFSGQPIAHGEVLWNALALGLLGLAGAFAGGCPVRQVVMSGEGNSTAFVCVAGIGLGGALAHNLGLVSASASAEATGGTTPSGRIAIVIGWLFCLAYAAWMLRAQRKNVEARSGVGD